MSMFKRLTHWILACLWVGVLPAQSALDKLTLITSEVYLGNITSYDFSEGVWLKLADTNTRFVPIDSLKRITFVAEQPGFLPKDRPYNDVLRMKDGAIFRGRTLSYVRGGHICLAIDTKTVLVVKDEKVYRVEYEKRAAGFSNRATVEANKERGLRANNFRTRGRYHSIQAGVLLAEAPPSSPVFIDPFNPFARSGANRIEFGYHLQYVLGYQFDRWKGVGAGLSLDAYNALRGESLLNLVGEYRSYLTKGRVAVYGLLNAGYGFAFRNSQLQVSKAKGGFLVHPALGLRLGASSQYNFTFDVGYRFQEAQFTQTLRNSGDTEIRELTYKRLLIQVGIVF